MTKEITYSIDFGTSNSLLAATVNRAVQPPLLLDPKNSDSSILRSVMYFSKSNPPSFGQEAIDSYVNESGEGRFIRSIKKYLPSDSFTGTQINSKVYSLEELIASFLTELKSRGDVHFQWDVKNLVLGRPAKFSKDSKKDALAEKRLQKAAHLAGFKNIEFFPEPLAAAYSYRKELSSEKLVLVVDLGGGTSDFTVIKVHPSDYSAQDVLSLGGVSIAGDAFDGTIMSEVIAPHFGSNIQYRFPMSNNILKMPNSLKLQLSSPADITLMSRSDIMGFLKDVQRSTLNDSDKDKLEQLFSLINDNLGFALFEKITQGKINACNKGHGEILFEDEEIYIKEHLNYQNFIYLSKDKLDIIFKTLDDVVTSAQIQSHNIDLICCTGGTSKIPAITQGLIKRFGEKKIQSFKNFHSVIQGLCERALEL